MVSGARITLSALQQQLGHHDEALEALQHEMEVDEHERPTFVSLGSFVDERIGFDKSKKVLAYVKSN